ncbi:hypothetical protein ABZP36_020744 [Zizania latifolia]
MARNQSFQSSVIGSMGASDHEIFGGSQSLADEVTEFNTVSTRNNYGGGHHHRECINLGTGGAEYPPNMVFYAEYLGWYFDTNTQQWHSLELYQMARTASVVQDGSNHAVVASSARTNYSVKEVDDHVDHNQVAQHNSFSNSHNHQSQWQTYVFSNTTQPESVKIASLADSFHGSSQHVNVESFSSSTNRQVSFNTAKTAMSHYDSKNLESSSIQGGYSAIGGQQASYKGFEPFTGHQAGYKGFEPSTDHQISHKMFDLSTAEVVTDKADASSITNGSALGYFHALCRQTIPGPLVGGSVSSKHRGDPRKLLISLLRILCQHYRKLRSPFASDPSKEVLPIKREMVVTKLFSSCKRSSIQMGDFGSNVHCMKNISSENQMQAVAQDVQNLLVSGRRKDALQCAQEGQLWGAAIILALQFGDNKMAHCHFLSRSPLQTLCLLIAGQPTYENLAIITANRTKGDDLVITHLGDCLWKEKNEVAAAHSCYLVAELYIDSYSKSARLCLLGADHLKCPRTFASPEAIQRTEVYEYAKVLGNSQYILLPFLPYKLIYAYMLVEVGRVADSLRYCQASMKVLKASSRTPELEAWKLLFSTLEERIRNHQQGGYGTNLALAKLVRKIFTSLDKSISRMMGTPSTPLPPLPQGPVSDRESYSAPVVAKFANSQSVMTMSSLMPSASIAHNRSVSEPDFGRTPKQGAGLDSTQGGTLGLGSSRFGWLGSTLQNTMGFVSKSHRQAKLGQQNKFYYDEKLRRWVKEGAEIPTEDPPLPPPPTKPSF